MPVTCGNACEIGWVVQLGGQCFGRHRESSTWICVARIGFHPWKLPFPSGMSDRRGLLLLSVPKGLTGATQAEIISHLRMTLPEYQATVRRPDKYGNESICGR